MRLGAAIGELDEGIGHSSLPSRLLEALCRGRIHDLEDIGLVGYPTRLSERIRTGVGGREASPFDRLGLESRAGRPKVHRATYPRMDNYVVFGCRLRGATDMHREKALILS